MCISKRKSSDDATRAVYLERRRRPPSIIVVNSEPAARQQVWRTVYTTLAGRQTCEKNVLGAYQFRTDSSGDF